MPHRLERSTWIARPIAEVFAFFAGAGNLERITPPELRFRILGRLPIEMQKGATIEYRLALFGVPFGWRTVIDHWEPPYRFVDRQLRGPYTQWVHTHMIRREHHGTRMDDRVDYRLPLGPLGLPALPLVRHQLKRVFDYREATIQRLLVEG